MSFLDASLRGPLEQTERPERSSGPDSSTDSALARICIELFTLAGLYAAVIGLIAGIGAALLFAD